MKTKSPVVVRQYKNSDFEAVVDLARSFLVRDSKRAEGTVRMALEDDRFIIFVAEINCKVAGFILLELRGWNQAIGEIWWIAVQLNLWRKGIGTELLKKTEQYAKERGVTKMLVETNVGNNISIPFYVKNGYQLEGTLSNHYEKGEDVLVLGKFLKTKAMKKVVSQSGLEQDAAASMR